MERANKGNKIFKFRLGHKKLSLLYYRIAMTGLMIKLGYQQSSDERRLFSDSSKSSSKVVLPHNRNVKARISVTYAVKMRETYEALKQCFLTFFYLSTPFGLT